MTAAPKSRANRRIALTAASVVVAMVGLAYASVPLYRLFCQVTGFGGTTQRADAAPGTIDKHVVTVRFNADIGGRDMPWQFEPMQREVTLHLGEERLIHYRATNTSAEPVVGTAVFNVTPAKAGIYFQKIACFCFEEQRLEAGESADMPVSFYVDPALATDPNTADVKTITLSYTFFRAKSDADAASRQQASAAKN